MTDEPRSALATFYAGWDTYLGELTKALAPLTPEQLAWGPAPNLRPMGGLATHMVGARARWFHDFLGEGAAEIAEMARWDRQGARPRTAAELVHGLNTTWSLMQACLARWTEADLAEVIQPPGDDERFSRAWVVWHLIEHDLHHGGELSYSLGMHGLAAPDI